MSAPSLKDELRPHPAARAVPPVPTRPRRLAVLQGQLGIGGSERQLRLLLSQCDREAWSPHVYVATSLGLNADNLRADGIPVTLLPGRRARRLWSFRRAFREQRAEALLSWSSWTNVFAPVLLDQRVPRVGSYRNAGFDDLPRRGRWLWSWASRVQLSTVVCNSPETADVLRQHCRPSQTVLFVPNAVEPVADVAVARRTWRRRLEVADDEVLVVGIGRLTHQKAFDVFVDAVALCCAGLDADAPRVRAIVVGPDHDGQAAALREQITATGLPSGTIRVFGASDAARELVCAADVYLLSSTHEGMPNVVLEAMSAGVPCVATPVGGVASVLTHEVDGLVAGHDAHGLAVALRRLVEDPALRRRLGQQARRRLEAHSPAAVYGPLWTALAAEVDRSRAAALRRSVRRTRIADVALCLLALPVAVPLGACVAVVVKTSGPGPVFHRGQRVGRDGVPFALHKFRTMHVGADRVGPGITAAEDPRVTPAGRWLRRSKLDELPQLIDVLAGSMSLVGPRPEDPRYVDLTSPVQRTALTVRPGLTSPASVRFRDEQELLTGPDWERTYVEQVLPAKLAMDSAWADAPTLRSYTTVLAQTLVAVLPRPRRPRGQLIAAHTRHEPE